MKGWDSVDAAYTAGSLREPRSRQRKASIVPVREGAPCRYAPLPHFRLPSDSASVLTPVNVRLRWSRGGQAHRDQVSTLPSGVAPAPWRSSHVLMSHPGVLTSTTLFAPSTRPSVHPFFERSFGNQTETGGLIPLPPSQSNPSKRSPTRSSTASSSTSTKTTSSTSSSSELLPSFLFSEF